VEGTGFDLAIGEDEDAVGETIGLGPVVGDVEEGDAGAGTEIGEDLTDVGAGFVVEGGEGFVEAEDGGLEGEGATEGDALGFAAAESDGAAVEDGIEVEPVAEFGDSLADAVDGPASEFEGEGQVLADGEVIEEGAVLGDETEAALARGGAGDIGAIDEDTACGYGAESADGFEEGGLAGAGTAHEGGVAAGRDLEGEVGEGEGAGVNGDVVEGDHVSVGSGKGWREVRRYG
jgi:hypothetical protein